MVNFPTRPEDSIDPLSRALEPPANETAEQRAVREAREAEARRVSDRIDEQIRSEKQANSRSRVPVKVLMLGQAESGTPPLPLHPLLFTSMPMRSTFHSPGKSTTVKGTSARTAALPALDDDDVCSTNQSHPSILFFFLLLSSFPNVVRSTIMGGRTHVMAHGHPPQPRPLRKQDPRRARERP